MASQRPTKAAFKKYVKEIVGELQPLFFLDEYVIDHVFDLDNESDEDDDVHRSKTVGLDTCSIEIDTTYLTATINYYKGIWELYKEGQMEEVDSRIFHELCHILTEPLSNFMDEYGPKETKNQRRELVERQTQRICNVFMNLKRSLIKEIPNVMEKLSASDSNSSELSPGTVSATNSVHPV